MSALARYFLAEGKLVAGYDRTSTPLTDALKLEGMKIHFEDDVTQIPTSFADLSLKDQTLVVLLQRFHLIIQNLIILRAKSFN